jgi:hypothetical protein
MPAGLAPPAALRGDERITDRGTSHHQDPRQHGLRRGLRSDERIVDQGPNQVAVLCASGFGEYFCSPLTGIGQVKALVEAG